MKLVKKATALLAVCALAIGMTACGTSSGSEIVAENENTKITMGCIMLTACIQHIIRPATMYLMQHNQFFLRRLMGSLPRIG